MRLGGILGQPKLLHVPYHADDLLRALAVGINHENVFADRVLAGEVVLGELFIDYRHRCRGLVVGIGQEASSPQWRLHHAQVLGLNSILESHRHLGAALRLRLSLDPEVLLIIAIHRTSARIDRLALHARDGVQRGFEMAIGSAHLVRSPGRQ